MNIKELCSYMWELEKELSLVEFEVEGVKPWLANRLNIHYELGKLLGIYDPTLPWGIKNGYNRILKILTFLKNSLLNNTFQNLYNIEWLIFSHPRSKLVDGEYIDIYTHFFIKDLEKEKKTFLEMERDYNGRHIRKKKPYKRYLDFLVLIGNFKGILNALKFEFRKDDLLFISKLENKILKELGIFLNLKKYFKATISKFKALYEMYIRLLEKTQPNSLVLTTAYGNPEIVKAGKDFGCRVIELQHGTFSKYHMGYFYPYYNKEIEYFPHEFWVWNKFWRNLIDFPIPKDNVKIYPFKYLEYEKLKYKDIEKKKQIVILSQGGMTFKIITKIIQNEAFFKEFQIIYKLHPNEYGNKEIYKNLEKLKLKFNLKVVEDVNLYKLFAESTHQCGVFSTALYEGIEFGCKTVLLNLPGIEYMEDFIKIFHPIIL